VGQLQGLPSFLAWPLLLACLPVVQPAAWGSGSHRSPQHTMLNSELSHHLLSCVVADSPPHQVHSTAANNWPVHGSCWWQPCT
jgi:hypothetical protein